MVEVAVRDEDRVAGHVCAFMLRRRAFVEEGIDEQHAGAGVDEPRGVAGPGEREGMETSATETGRCDTDASRKGYAAAAAESLRTGGGEAALDDGREHQHLEELADGVLVDPRQEDVGRAADPSRA